MAKLSVSVDVPLPPEKAWECASDLSRYKEWLTIHRVWRSKLPETLEKGTVIESIVEVKGMPNRIKWTIVHFKPPEAMTLNGDGVGGVKVKLIGKVKPSGDGSTVTFDVHLGGPALFGPIGMVVAAALQGRHPRVAEQVQERLRPCVTAQRRNRLLTSLVNSTVDRRTDSSSSETNSVSTIANGSVVTTAPRPYSICHEPG